MKDWGVVGGKGGTKGPVLANGIIEDICLLGNCKESCPVILMPQRHNMG